MLSSFMKGFAYCEGFLVYRGGLRSRHLKLWGNGELIVSDLSLHLLTIDSPLDEKSLLNSRKLAKSMM
jgi:hypothetical protein